MSLHPKIYPLVFALSLAFAPDAVAGSTKIKFGTTIKHGSFSIQHTQGYGHKPPAAPHCGPPPSVWVPGHYQSVPEQVWIPGNEQRIWIQPVFELRYDSCGRGFTFCIEPGRWKTVCQPGHYETRNVQVWVPPHWQGPPPMYTHQTHGSKYKHPSG